MSCYKSNLGRDSSECWVQHSHEAQSIAGYESSTTFDDNSLAQRTWCWPNTRRKSVATWGYSLSGTELCTTFFRHCKRLGDRANQGFSWILQTYKIIYLHTHYPVHYVQLDTSTYFKIQNLVRRIVWAFV